MAKMDEKEKRYWKKRFSKRFRQLLFTMKTSTHCKVLYPRKNYPFSPELNTYTTAATITVEKLQEAPQDYIKRTENFLEDFKKIKDEVIFLRLINFLPPSVVYDNNQCSFPMDVEFIQIWCEENLKKYKSDFTQK